VQNGERRSASTRISSRTSAAAKRRFSSGVNGRSDGFAAVVDSEISSKSSL
jgi:hypothetical protein